MQRIIVCSRNDDIIKLLIGHSIVLYYLRITLCCTDHRFLCLSDLWKMSDAQTAATVGDQLDVLNQALIVRGRTKGLRSGNISIKLPLRYNLSLCLEYNWRVLCTKRLKRYFIQFFNCKAGCWIVFIHNQTIVPTAGGEYLAQGRLFLMFHLQLARIVAIIGTPVLFDLKSVDQGTFFDSDGIIIPSGCFNLTWEVQVNLIPCLPIALDGVVFAGNNAFLLFPIDRDFWGVAPLRDAQFQFKFCCFTAVAQMNGIFKWIVGFLYKGCRFPIGHFRCHAIRPIGYQRQTVVRCCHPHVLDKLWPTHMTVSKTTVKTKRCAKRRAVPMVAVKLMVAKRCHHLILQYIIGMAREIRRIGCRKRIVSQLLYAVTKPSFTQNFLSNLCGKQALHNTTSF